jgi:hypothetical protein
MNSTEKLDLQVSESNDGSAMVSVVESGFPVLSNNDSHEGEGSSSRDSDVSDNGADNIPDIDPEREAIRVARREERSLKKQIHKAKASESNHLITALKRQNEQMADRLAVLEKRTAGSDLARIDKAIEDGHLRLQYAKLKIKEATEMANGAALADAQEQWYDSRRQVEALEALKKKVVSEPSQQQNVPQAPDPSLKRHAGNWMARNDWFDPEGGDTDSQIATKIDESLVKEGWDPKSGEYWEELDNRLSKYLPHRYNTDNDEKSSNRRPRSVVTSSGRESRATTKSNEFYLSPDRVRAIKDAGRWDNLAERNKMIRRYAEYDRMNRS